MNTGDVDFVNKRIIEMMKDYIINHLTFVELLTKYSINEIDEDFIKTRDLKVMDQIPIS